MRYEKCEPGVVQYKSSHRSDVEFKRLNINSRRRKMDTALNKCYSAPLTVSLNKKRDLIDMLPFIKPEFHNFYQNLKCEGECEIEIDSDIDEIDNTES